MVAAIGKTEAQIHGLSILLAIILSALGGMMVPLSSCPMDEQRCPCDASRLALSGYHTT